MVLIWTTFVFNKAALRVTQATKPLYVYGKSVWTVLFGTGFSKFKVFVISKILLKEEACRLRFSYHDVYGLLSTTVL